jgi:hypothetical protein
MRSFALIEGDRSTMMHVRNDGDVTVFDRDRESAIRFRIPMDVDEFVPSWSVIWRVDQNVEADQADAMARNTFAVDARATMEDALRWHEIHEAHCIEHGYGPNHWK